MSWLPHYNENSWASPYYARSWFLRDYSGCEQVIYSVVPFYVHPKVCFSTPEIYNCAANPFVVAPPWSPLAFNHHQRESISYKYITAGVNAAAEMNAAAETNDCRIDVLEKSGIQSSSDTKAVFKSHQLPSGPERTGLHKNIGNLIASEGLSDASTLEQRGSRIEKNEHKSTVFLNTANKFEYSGKNEINNISSEQQAGTNCSISSQSCYLSVSELNLTEENLTNLSSSVGEELESLCKEPQKISIPPEDAAEEDGNVYIDEDLSPFTDYRCSDLDDSQLEYHSAEEQDCVCHSPSYTQKPGTSETFHNKKLSSEDRLTGGKPQLEDESSNTSCSIISNYYSFSERPEFSQTFQDGNCTADHDEKMKTSSFTDTAWIYKMSTNRGLFKKTDNSSADVSQRTGNAHVMHQERTLVPLVHASSGSPDISASCAHEQSVVFSPDEICTCKLCGRCKENFPNSELNNIMYLSNIANANQSTVNQAIDATSDFRACFTTSRATNVKVSVVTRAQNTVITMMSKHRPNEWLTDSHRSVACNTDWSCMYENVEATDSQISITSMLENSFVSDATKQGWKQKTEDPWECKNSTSKDVDEIPTRLMHLSQEISDQLPNCCKEVWLRAIKAEMQLLKIRYQMCHHHCWRTYKPLMKEKEHIHSSCETRKSVSQVSFPENMESSSHSLVTHQMSKKHCPSNKNAERKKDLIEDDCQETTEDWSDVTENLPVSDSSLSLTEAQSIHDRKKVSENTAYIHVGSLGPLVSEVDLWLHFQRYNVSEISICEYSDSYRYASLSFKSAHDASLAVKEMNEKPIKGKAVKVQLVQTVGENEVPNDKSSVKRERENRKPPSSSEKTVEHEKNCNGILKVPPSALAAPRVVAGGPVSSKRPDASKDSLKSSSPALSNTATPISVPSKVPVCASAPSKVPDPDFKHTKPSSGNACFEIDQEDIAEGLLPLGSVQCTPSPSSTFVPPNALNLRSFRKIVKRLEELHPEVSRDNILDALVKIKESRGLLSGLPLSTIVQITSSILNKQFTSKSEENQDNNLRNK